MSDIQRTGVIYLAVVPSLQLIGDDAFPWSLGLEYLPSLDNPDLRAWLNEHHADLAGDRTTADDLPEAAVWPDSSWPAKYTRFPHQRLEVPYREYVHFTAAVDDPSGLS
ncbi:hypothetical protein [Nocardia terpenica]|uniref:Uncharacterized protein n=1 Tax=Nocardia terpenica TaxID=455432 RepID=A0A6G9ZDM5_9NOCA|nr:hypothetical protein [Nocardia terpenica]QIS23725.1 hypothetical protein F6W96_41035 [Nocardia terpenica]